MAVWRWLMQIYMHTPQKKSTPVRGTDRKTRLPAQLLPQAGTLGRAVHMIRVHKDLWSLN